ncbi:Flp pilus assembly protein CpaB [Tuwongella immobilis]|uniref:Flp pilus assembly protein RcpC/CpaB domain-containing protein n=1 Tax=Tuwongella immobilis TaxID=692036 RepID=A0A6C2YW74_9BACT|nr:Flp pilus assembly protein CpaB [Tuwongella immobilis]VIP05704.1 Putative uncharacterized protein OS=uncultured planctomycete GN=HGMM_F12C05C31 PE=4 SV=1 [Tuwongella immobilis]VTS08764.1 Putative uncharacterized protein OS=uncultured planctomycete GN=HGMM_F12C05C31 PE=4 SV=1 [Tuwongella immobilis]
MRASLLLVITLAVLVGLAVAVFVRQSGLLNPPAPVVKAEPQQGPLVLVASRTFFKGDVFFPPDLALRPLRVDEVKDYEANRAQYLPPSIQAAYLRYAAGDIPADRPLKLSDLDAMRKPEPLAERLPPGTKAINLGIDVNMAEGGQIAVGDWVDVYVTSVVGRSDKGDSAIRTALLAKAALVVSKRNSLWPVYAPLAKDEPVYHTLAVNPFRAAMLEYAQTVGKLSLVTVSKDEQTRLKQQRDELKEPADVVSLSFPDAKSEAHQRELARLQAYQQGSLVIGNSELMDIFALEPLPVPVMMPPARTVEVFTGVSRSGEQKFAPAMTPVSQERPQYTFQPLPDKPKADDDKAAKPRPSPVVSPIGPKSAPAAPKKL